MKKLKLNKKNVTRIRRAVSILITALIILSTCILPTFAADEGTGLEDSFGKVKLLEISFAQLIGYGFGIFGIIEFGIAWNAHDGAGKLKGLTCIGIGLLAYFSQQILAFLGIK